MTFQATVEALTNAIVRDLGGDTAADTAAKRQAVSRFVLDQHARMPDYLRFPFKIFTLVFAYWPLPFTGRPFHNLPHDKQAKQVDAWRNSTLRPRKSLIEFFSTLIVFGWYTELYPAD